MSTIQLFWHDYRYFPYELDLAAREAARLCAPAQLQTTPFGFKTTVTDITKAQLEKLVYFRCFAIDDDFYPTSQHLLETSMPNGGTHKKQITRYSVHGLHEYKGKFNPQIVRGVLNLLGATPDTAVFDPFCGSGTTLIECVHGKLNASGCDINPLAVYISNAKLLALVTASDTLEHTYKKITVALDQTANQAHLSRSNEPRADYLQNWFEPSLLMQIEMLRKVLLEEGQAQSQIFLALASDIIREYSLQDPDDLRIRRRRTPLPTKPLFTAFQEKIKTFLANVKAAQQVIGVIEHQAKAYTFDSRCLSNESANFLPQIQFDMAITSPPYATALPYIDTQRLSLVWLDLCSPQEVRQLDAMLTGSREFVQTRKGQWEEHLQKNERKLSPSVHEFCLLLQQSISTEDGFRRKAVPALLYRYFSDMQDLFRGMTRVVKQNAPFALVIGHNHTILGGKRFDIDTPQLLKEIAIECGWSHTESIALQTYQRYSMHNANAVRDETLLILQRL